MICFPPLQDGGIRLLILGSFPSVASLQAQQYYAHPRNQFWPLLGALLGQDLPHMPYPARLQTLLQHRIGLWDVYAACEREGSLDADIRQGEANDFAWLAQQCPQLRAAAFNGRTAARFAPQLAALGWQTPVLPSSSPAHAGLRFADKLELWRSALLPLLQD